MRTVSVIIPTYNREKYVIKAIESVLAQTYGAYEIIVVDDGSNDNTREHLKKFINRINYIHQNNSGVSAARNMGIQHAHGEWLAFLDSDDEWMPDYLETQVSNLERYSNICMQATNMLITNDGGESHPFFRRNGPVSEFEDRDYLYFAKPFSFIVKHPPMRIGVVIALREAVIRAGLFDEKLTLSEELDLMARIALQGSFGIISKICAVAYRRFEETEHLTKKIENDLIFLRENNENIFKKLYKIKSLESRERKVLKKMLGANRRAIGNMLVTDRRFDEARKSYMRAFLFDRSFASMGKFVLSFLPEKLITRLAMVPKILTMS